MLGDQVKTCAENGAEYLHFDENQRDALAESVKAKLQPGDCVLLKGSNSMKLGEVAARLLKD